MNYGTAWIYDPFYYAWKLGTGSSMSIGTQVSGGIYRPVEFQQEELHCEYCGRRYARGAHETCQGCGAPQ